MFGATAIVKNDNKKSEWVYRGYAIVFYGKGE